MMLSILIGGACAVVVGGLADGTYFAALCLLFTAFNALLILAAGGETGEAQVP